jgi:hypothetical protein
MGQEEISRGLFRGFGFLHKLGSHSYKQGLIIFRSWAHKTSLSGRLGHLVVDTLNFSLGHKVML